MNLNPLIDRIQVAKVIGDDEALVRAREESILVDDARTCLDDSVGASGLAAWLERLERIKEWVDFSQRERPWLTRRVVDFLDAHLSRTHALVEWSSGRSTRWYARRVKHVTAVEHDPGWHRTVSAWGIPNCTLHLRPVTGPGHIPAYVHAVASGAPYDVAIIDGLYYRRCVAACCGSDFLRPGALVVLDDSDRASRDGWGIPASWELVLHDSRAIRSGSIWRVTGSSRKSACSTWGIGVR
jgi:hypothetical protein